MTKNKRDKIIKTLLVLAVLFLILKIFVFNRSSLYNLYKEKRLYENVKSQNKILEEENERLSMENKNLKNDYETIEKLVREKIGYAKEKETIIHFLKDEGE